jgi:hypothetical protein
MKKKDQWEEDAKDHFVAALKAEGRGDWVVSSSDVIVDEKINLNFDYQLQRGSEFIALEVFRLVDSKQEIERQKSWELISNSIAAELRKRGVKGFTISTPNTFNVPPNKVEKFVSKIADNLEHAIEQNPGADPIQESGFEIKRIEDFPDVSLYTIGPGGAIDPTGMAYRFIERKLPKKNGQLNIQGHERVVLIVNWLLLVDQRNMIEACGQIDFSQFGNIDKVYFDIPHSGSVHLVYDKSVYTAFQQDGDPPKQIGPLFISWLTNYLYRKNLQAFRLVQKIAEREKSLLWLPAHAREQLTSFGEDFLKQDQAEDLYWIVDYLQQDPDPSVENAPNDPTGKFNDHRQVLNGAHIRLTRSVRARLCWLLMLIVVRPRLEDYERVFEIIERFATGENLYVRHYATFALMELARRRFARTDTGTRYMSDKLAARIKTLGLRMVEENANYPVVLESVANVMLYVLDLDEGTALNAVQQLLRIENSDAADDISSIMIYFALFRENQFKHLDPFDPKRLKDLLLDRLANGSGRFRAFAVSHFKNLLGLINKVQFEALVPYLEAVIGGKPDRLVNHHFYRIAATQAANNPEIVGRLIEQTVLAELNASDQKGREVWYPKEFANALDVLENAGPEHKGRIAGLRLQMEPYKDRIVNLYDF